MNFHRDAGRGSQRLRRALPGVMVMAALAIALAGAMALLLRRSQRLRGSAAMAAFAPDFDARACVRLLDVSRVYRIRQQVGADALWFATAEGIRIFRAQTSEWIRMGMDHGLPSETVTDICFSQGMAWIGSWNGIAVGDSCGSRCETLPASAGLAGRRILAIESAGAAGVFCSVDGGGVFRLKTAQGPAARVELPAVRPTDRITCLRYLPPALYIGAEGRRLFAYRPDTQELKELVFARAGSRSTLLWDALQHGGALWIATSDDGVWRRDSVVGDTLRPVTGFPAKGAYCFAEETDGFWCGTPYGLWRYHSNAETWIQFVHPEQRAATDFQVFALANTPDALWYGSMDLGAGYLTKTQVEWRPLRAGLSNPNVAAIAVVDTTLWTGYGYQGGGLDRFFAATVQYDRNFGVYDGVGDAKVQALAVDVERLYFGTFGGFGYYEPKRRVWRYFDTDSGLPHPDIADILPGRPVLLASLHGVIRFDPATGAFSTIAETEDWRITSIARTGDSLWLGTLGRGAIVFNMSTRRIDTTLVPHASRITACLTIRQAGGANLVAAATRENGVLIADLSNGRISALPLPPNSLVGGWGAYENHLMAARVIDGDVWLGTRNAGCFVYRPRAGNWHALTQLDGLVSNQIRSLFDTETQVWIGCYGGCTRFDKEYLTKKLLRR